MLELLAKKIGMTHVYKNNGVSIAVTMIKLHDNRVIESDNSKEDCNPVSLAFIKTENFKKISKSVIGIFNKKQIPVYKKIHCSKLKKTTEINVGDSIEISKFLKEGDKISVRGTTSGKGFAGVMKRWNFRGLEASHGVSVSHRSHGSTGQRQDPGKTFKGKKMAGHLGVDNITIKNLEIEFIDNQNSVIAVRGSVPGKNGSDLIVKLSNY
jgi:large subunit ribosomal protein L3